MTAPPAGINAPPDRIRFTRDGASGVEAIRARFAGHAYDLHRHDDWLVGVTDRGVQDFFCRGARQRSTPGRVILIEPGEMHDGQAGNAGGFAYSMLYLPPAWLRAGLAGAPGGDPAFRATLSDDAALGGAVRAACSALAEPAGRLARDAALDAVLRLLRRHLGRPERRATAQNDAPVARRARERLHDEMDRDIGADALARAAGAADRFQLARAFRAAYGASPHAYLVQIRLLRARAMLAGGERPAAVAAACGFADQSHLGRWFRRSYGLTPAAYRACCTGVPDNGADIG
ncbi:AraC family transcriptional regulator [Methylocapsa sp. S129]|uniref:AraC family transcriptional regulator n=1 Tax=Methylocapsa sp. S129 TaxID=1641869 RepID=UPI001AED13F1|nr:AraC family transcriptional regulator [Methylocapsa sp. S129]